jgi:predicted metal-binding membrane protein
MQNATSLEAVLKRDRTVVVTGLVGISVLAWAYIIYLAWNMEHMDMEVAMPQMQAWGMVPSAAPLILIFAAANRKRKERKDPFVHTAVFLTGYLLVWTGFSALATLAQWGLHNAALLSPMMKSTQWTPFKHACLTHCRSPLGFLMAHWREGTKGSLMMGVEHGSYCVGCCWFLMALLFVAGVMNLLWVAIIAAFVLAEKVLPRGDLVGRVAGGMLVLARSPRPGLITIRK